MSCVKRVPENKYFKGFWTFLYPGCAVQRIKPIDLIGIYWGTTTQFTCSKSPNKDFALLHCSMFKLTHPSSLLGRKSHTQLGIVLKGACHLASLRLAHTHMHTVLGQSGIAPNNRRLGLVFPWQSAPAIFPRWQRNPAPSAARSRVCVSMCKHECESIKSAILYDEEHRCSDTHSADSSLDPFAIPPHVCKHRHALRADSNRKSVQDLSWMHANLNAKFHVLKEKSQHWEKTAWKLKKINYFPL